MLISGHLGQLGRFGLFLMVSIFMWRSLEGQDTNNGNQNTIGAALSSLQVRRDKVGFALPPFK